MQQLVSRHDIAINGEQITDLKNFKRLKRTHRKIVEMMNKTGFVKLRLRHAFSVDYVIPAGARYDFGSIENGTILVMGDDGTPLEFFGVVCVEEGDQDSDGEKEIVSTILFGAERASDDKE